MIAGPATLATLREINASVVFTAIRADPPVSRAELARRLGMTKPTVGNALDLLLAAGLVREADRPGQGHHGAVFFGPAPDVALVLALDLGRRSVRGAVADLGGRLLAHRDEPLAGTGSAAIAAAARRLRDALAVPGVPVELAVVGVPGVVDPAGGAVSPAAPPVPVGMVPAAVLGAALGLEVIAENDINLAACAEQAAGLGRDVPDFAFLHVGSGVGAGLVLGGALYAGSRGAAGEVDVHPRGPSGEALAALAEQRLAMGAETALRAPVTAEAVVEAALAGDALGGELVAEETRRIAGRIAEIARVADPGLVVLGGGIGLAYGPFLPELRAELARLLPRPPRVELSGLGERPVLLGGITLGARLAWERLAARRLHSAAVS